MLNPEPDWGTDGGEGGEKAPMGGETLSTTSIGVSAGGLKSAGGGGGVEIELDRVGLRCLDIEEMSRDLISNCSRHASNSRLCQRRIVSGLSSMEEHSLFCSSTSPSDSSMITSSSSTIVFPIAPEGGRSESTDKI